MRFWDPRRAAAYKIVEDAVAFYGLGRVRAIADHFMATSPQEALRDEASAKLPLDDEQTLLLFTKLRGLKLSSNSMFENVKSEIKKYSSESTSSGASL